MSCVNTGSLFCFAMSEINPVSQGPSEQPISPNTASIPNIAVPEPGNLSALRLKVPGHIRLTERPQKAEPISDNSGQGANTVVR